MDELHQTGELLMVATGIAAEAGESSSRKGRIRFPPLFRMWAATVLTSATLESRFCPNLVFDPLQFITIGLPDVRHAVDSQG